MRRGNTSVLGLTPTVEGISRVESTGPIFKLTASFFTGVVIAVFVVFAVVVTTIFRQNGLKNLAKSTTDEDYDQEGGLEQLYGSPIDESITVMRTRVPFNTVCLLNDAGLLWNETDSCIVPHYYPPRRFFSGSQLSSISEQA